MSRVLALLLLVGCTPEFTPISDDSLDDEPTDTEVPLDTSVEDTQNDTGNYPPVADAGPDQEVGVTEVVDLDGSASYDEDGDTLSFSWDFVSLPTDSNTSIINSSTNSPSFWADTEGTFVVELTVDDGAESSTDTVQVVVIAPNDVPVAYAGPDQTVNVGDTVQLTGSGSYDPDGDPLTYAWRFVSQPGSSTLSSATAESPRFTASTAGTYTVELVVNDGTNSSAPDSVRIVAQAADDGDCLSCSAQVEQEVRRRLTTGTHSGGPLLVVLPLLALAFFRRDD
ncbi:MAG: PKD domain-containing protein [Deltaproteobacteria bacterium]|nr:MAG: PKD domain-containing protein [Deltaproteobacteria bacterium]